VREIDRRDGIAGFGEPLTDVRKEAPVLEALEAVTDDDSPKWYPLGATPQVDSNREPRFAFHLKLV
jgi:hypothetical protein